MTILRSTPDLRTPEPGVVVEVKHGVGSWRPGRINMYGHWYVKHTTSDKWWRSNPPTEWRERKGE